MGQKRAQVPLPAEVKRTMLPLAKLVVAMCKHRKHQLAHQRSGPIKVTAIMNELEALGFLGYTGWRYNYLQKQLGAWSKAPLDLFRFNYSHASGFTVTDVLHSDLRDLGDIKFDGAACPQIPLPPALEQQMQKHLATALGAARGGGSTANGEDAEGEPGRASAAVEEAVKSLNQVIWPADYVPPVGARVSEFCRVIGIRVTVLITTRAMR